MIGKQLAHYRIVDLLGRGGMGELFIAEDTRLNRKVALKVLPAEMAADPERRARFEREARAVAALNHPNIVTLHSVEEEEGAQFITMELVEGEGLSEKIPKGGMPLGKLFEIAIPLADALAAAHKQGRLKQELKKYVRPVLLLIDELGFLPIDKKGADLLFQVISLRYERGALVITSNKAFKDWPEIFNNDATLTSAILDRLLHHAETVLIEGKSYRMKDQIEP